MKGKSNKIAAAGRRLQATSMLMCLYFPAELMDTNMAVCQWRLNIVLPIDVHSTPVMPAQLSASPPLMKFLWT
jgi:hypothetical protein